MAGRRRHMAHRRHRLAARRLTDWRRSARDPTWAERIGKLRIRVGYPRGSEVDLFDWHSGQIDRATPITMTYRNTQKVRRFFKAECGEFFKFGRAFMAWLKVGVRKTMGDAADEWTRREATKRQRQVPSRLQNNGLSNSKGGG
jgi:hypothetical protein